MDRPRQWRPPDRPFDQVAHAPPPSPFPPPFPAATAQPPIQIPYSDPLPQSRDPFLQSPYGRREHTAGTSRPWTPAQGNPNPSPAPPHSLSHPPPHTADGAAAAAAAAAAAMSLPYDPSRRRSLGAAGSPPQFAAGPSDSPAGPPPYSQRAMPPPSPPQLAPSSSTASSYLPGSAPRGPPTASPFAGIRDLASLSSSHRPSGGMSISSILGNGAEEKTSPHSSFGLSSSAQISMRPPSPGRVRSSSMREHHSRGFGDSTPPRMGAPVKTGSGDHARTGAEQRRDGLFGSPQDHREIVHGFRAFQAPPADNRRPSNGDTPPGRPSSQPAELAPSRPFEDTFRRDDVAGARLGMFRAFGEVPPSRNDGTPRQESAALHNGAGPTSQPASAFSTPRLSKETRDGFPTRYQSASFGTPMREDQAGLFRPALPPQPQGTPGQARESIEARPSLQDFRRDYQRSSPPLSDIASHDRLRNGFHERPLTLEEHQRMETMNRELQQRKDSPGSGFRALFTISPELNRRGRNSPLPQAVQGAQPRHVGPGGDNPGIKSEFGRMFSGLGSGVGSTTPTAGQSVNGANTPARVASPVRHAEGGDLVRTAVAELEEGRGGSKSGRGGRKTRDELEKAELETYDGRMTPSLSQRGSKRAKTTHPLHRHHHHHHHAHHHHHEPAEPHQGSYSMLRFPSNPLSQSGHASATPHHHHHHHATHATHAHPNHHHHHPPRSTPLITKKPTTTIINKDLLVSVSRKPRKHLGSALYTSSLSLPPAKLPSDRRIRYANTVEPIPRFDGGENCTFTVRVPRWLLSRTAQEIDAREPSRLEEICKRRQVWGSEVYTDDSDVVAAAVHAGWIRGDFGELDDDLRGLGEDEAEPADAAADADADADAPRQFVLDARPRRPVDVPLGHDMHVTVLVLPPLDAYASTHAHHVLSREWAGAAPHDGMSFMVHRVEFVDEGAADRGVGRDAKSRKRRIVLEERRRREAAAALLMLPGVGKAAGGTVSVSA